MTTVFGVRYAFGVFFKPMVTEFGWTSAMTSGAFSISMAMEGFLAIVMGGLNDRFGPRRVLTLCGLLLALGYMLMSQVNSIWQLYVFYGLIVGVSMSGFYVPLLSTIARWFTARRTFMTGIVLAGIGIGALIGAPAADKLISTYDWRTSFIILGVIIFVVVISVAQFMKRDPAQVGQLSYGANREMEQETKSDTHGFSLSAAVRTRQFWLLFATLICFGFGYFAVIVHIVPHAVELEISPATAANILAIIGGLIIAGRIVLGGAADRIGNKPALIIGFILMSVSLLLLIPAREVWMLYLCAAILGFADGGIGASQSPLVAKYFGLRSHGKVFGLIAIGFTTGSAIGPFVTGYIYDITGSYQMAFLLCAALSFISLVLILLLRPLKSNI